MIKYIFLIFFLLLVMFYLSPTREGFSSPYYHLNKKVNSTIRYFKTQKKKFLNILYNYGKKN